MDPWCSPGWVLGNHLEKIPESPSASVSFQPASGLWKLASSTYENLPGASGRQFQV